MGDYERKVNAATLEQLAGLIKICGFLMQTKAYLFWRLARLDKTLPQTKPNTDAVLRTM
jgi:hypothetical protein